MRNRPLFQHVDHKTSINKINLRVVIDTENFINNKSESQKIDLINKLHKEITSIMTTIYYAPVCARQRHTLANLILKTLY